MAAAVPIDAISIPPREADDALVARTLAGDESAFVALYDRWAPRVMRFALSRLGDREDAEDVAQEVFLAALRGLSSYQGRSCFGTWLLGISYHLIGFVLVGRLRRLVSDALLHASKPLAELLRIGGLVQAAGRVPHFHGPVACRAGQAEDSSARSRRCR